MVNWVSWVIDNLEQMKQQQRALRKTNRDLERDRSALDRQEKQLVSVLKQKCSFLNNAVCRKLRSRKQLSEGTSRLQVSMLNSWYD